MNNTRNDNDWIEDYLDGSLDASEQEAFRSRLESDPLFAKKLQQRIQLQEAWKSTKDYHELNEKLKGIIHQERSASSYRRNMILVAASVIIIAGIASILLFVLPDKSGLEIQKANVLTDSLEQNKQTLPQEIGIPRYAKSDTVASTLKNIKLLAPENSSEFFIGDTVRFRWEPASGNSFFVLKEKDTKKIISKVTFNEGEDSYSVGTKEMTSGTYSWFINDSLNTHEFLLKSNK